MSRFRFWAARHAGLASAAAAAAAWHLAGAVWAVGLMALAIGWLAGQLTAAKLSSADLAKSYSTEGRVDALVPKVADAHNAANTAQSTANSAQSTANSAQSTADNALPKTGGSVNGDLHVYGYLYGSGGTLTCGDALRVNGRLYLPSGSIPQSLGGGAAQNNDGFGGGVWTANQASHLSSWQDNYNLTVNFVNNMRDALNAAGIF